MFMLCVFLLLLVLLLLWLCLRVSRNTQQRSSMFVLYARVLLRGIPISRRGVAVPPLLLVEWCLLSSRGRSLSHGFCIHHQHVQVVTETTRNPQLGRNYFTPRIEIIYIVFTINTYCLCTCVCTKTPDRTTDSWNDGSRSAITTSDGYTGGLNLFLHLVDGSSVPSRISFVRGQLRVGAGCTGKALCSHREQTPLGYDPIWHLAPISTRCRNATSLPRGEPSKREGEVRTVDRELSPHVSVVGSGI